MDVLLELDVLQAAGWALLHFLWQGTAITLLTVLLLRAMASQPAAWRCRVSMGMLALAPMLLAGTIALQLRGGEVAASRAEMLDTNASTVAPRAPGIAASADTDAFGNRVPNARDRDRVLAIVALIWLTVVLALTVRLARTWRSAERLARMVVSHAVPAAVVTMVEQALARAREQMGVHRAVRVVCMPHGFTPAVVGWLRIVVLFPASVVSGLTPGQIELLLAHELAHIARHDFFVNVLQSWVETLFFFHPGIWWMSNRIRLERELACDETVVERYPRPTEYGEALATLSLLKPETAALSLAASASPLLLRVRRLFGVAEERELTPHRWLLALALPGLLLALFAGGQLASAQSTMHGMLDDQGTAAAQRVIARHDHANRLWRRSTTVVSELGDGQLASELRLGKRLSAMHFVARLKPADGGAAEVLALRVTTYSWTGAHTVELIPRPASAAARPRADSLVLLFIRESGLNASSRAASIVLSGGTEGVLREVNEIGDGVVQARYLLSGVAAAKSPAEREQLVHQALNIRGSAPDVSAVLRAGMKAAAGTDELTALVNHVPQVDGEAERLALLIAALAITTDRPEALRLAIERAVQTLPGEDARVAVRRAMGPM